MEAGEPATRRGATVCEGSVSISEQLGLVVTLLERGAAWR